ncbi:MAG TPA: hypothetical protein V6C88_09825 [Chroococcidiopsis sp.]
MSVPNPLLWQLLKGNTRQPDSVMQGSDRPPVPNRSEQGLSILECLMAIAVIGLTAAMITPPLFIASATRVQNRRAEQAIQLAQGEVDRIAVVVAKSEHTPARLPSVVVGASDLTTLQAAAAPNAIASNLLDSVNTSCNTYREQLLPVNTVREIDVDGDCQADYYVQTFRTAGRTSQGQISSGTNKPTSFQLGVRVYSFLAKDRLLAGTLSTQPASLTITSGLGSQRTRPLAVLYTDMRWSEQSFTACDYRTTTGDCSTP